MPATTLVVIDAQQEYFAPLGKVVLPGGPAAVTRIARALAWARAESIPIVHIVHESRKPVMTKHLPGSFTEQRLSSSSCASAAWSASS